MLLLSTEVERAQKVFAIAQINEEEIGGALKKVSSSIEKKCRENDITRKQKIH